mgnify:CR=1 FL=1|tara:strand:- start:381985 stop:383145 length:1161 start_codon:yes stop_codon:yes gene_type:complete
MLDKSTAKTALRSIKNIFKKAAKYTAITAISAFTAVALSVSSVYSFGESMATESYRDYGASIGITQQAINQSPVADQIRVYGDGTAAYLFKVGQMTALETNYRIDNENDEDDTLGRAWTAVTVAPHTLVKYMSAVKDQHYNQHPLNAYAWPDYREGATCYINPPGDMTLLEFTSMFTGIHGSDLADLHGVKDIDPKIPVMLHEASHCSNNPPRTMIEYYMKSFKLQGESRGDNDTIKAIETYYADSIMPELLHNIRAVAPLASPYGVDAIHATTPLMKTPLLDEYAKEDVYAAYVHLNELVKSKQTYYHPQYDGPYFFSTYLAINDIINSDADITDATRRAGQLYMEGIEYLVPAVRELDLAQTTQQRPKQEEASIVHKMQGWLGL